MRNVQPEKKIKRKKSVQQNDGDGPFHDGTLKDVKNADAALTQTDSFFLLRIFTA